ncbi:MAG: ATP-binding protein [Gemmatimonadota bacterium]|nr:ATP-binding protein [Gemmatimonadota bacterium]
MTDGAAAGFVAPDATIDLTNCDREPIHIPGAIQPYGVLFALREPSLEVVMTSASVHAILAVPPADVIGRRFEDVFGAAAASEVRSMLSRPSSSAFCRLRLGRAESAFDAVVHRSDGLAILELEPAAETSDMTVERMSSVMRETVRRVETAESLADLAQSIADEMRALTGFDRVWVYRFHPDWHGEIIGESRREGIETWLGMHYPASDIPTQARALFLRNWVRVIPDIAFTPSPLEPQRDPLTQQPLDLGGSLLRSVSPIHVEYLKNMGVTASLVISLIHRGKLWGLISGHHYSGPKWLHHADRALCEFLAQALSLQIGSADRLEDRRYALEIRERQTRLFERLVQSSNPNAAVTKGSITIADLISASGALIVRGIERMGVGVTPSDPQVDALLAWLQALPEDIFETSALPSQFKPAEEFADVASGLLSVAITRDRRDMLLWFRGEQRQTVKWAGDPRKPVTFEANGAARLHPRGSFALWEEEARGTSVPWRAIEVEAARDVRRALLDIQIRRSEEISRLNEELLVTNAQLEESAAEMEIQSAELMEQREERESLLDRERAAREESERANRAKADFLAVMSHELRTPLNAIGGYAQLMSLGMRGPLTSEQSSDIDRIQVNQRHLLGLINSILNFTKLEAGQIQFTIAPVLLADLLNGLDALVAPQMQAKSIRFTVSACDPAFQVLADSEKLRQIMLNLLTNALKFTDAGGTVTISCARDGASVAIGVADTGRGIAADAAASVFEPFIQIDRHSTPASEQGVGLGLAISRELARAMHGDLQLTSEVGVGSTFTVRLPAAN